ncbi:MAG: alpha/beta fold hydrolase, partial [Chloroflexota bacterium]
MINEHTIEQTNQLPNQPSIQPTDQYITIANIRLRYWQMGARGSPVLLLHGLNGCVENWRWNIGVLAAQHRVFALDGPGHGLSQPDDRAFNLDFMRDLIVEFIRAQGLERTSLVALSGSGLVTLKLALERPARVDKLVLADAAGLERGINARMRLFSMTPPPPPGVMPRQFSRDELRYWLNYAFFRNRAALTEPMLDDFHANLARPHTMVTAARLMRWGVNLFGQKFVFTHRLHQISAPTLIIWGQQDRLLPVRHAHRAARNIPNARVV